MTWKWVAEPNAQSESKAAPQSIRPRSNFGLDGRYSMVVFSDCTAHPPERGRRVRTLPVSPLSRLRGARWPPGESADVANWPSLSH